MLSPYDGIDLALWEEVTRKLVGDHPLEVKELVKIILDSWEDILCTDVGGYRIGKDILPKPQILGFFLHELIPLKIISAYPDKWRLEKLSSDKDIVCLANNLYSVEIKTSSQKNVYGNRSYSKSGDSAKKSKSGYYLIINFEKFTDNKYKPSIRQIRFGWLDHEDWKGQKSETGQQATVSPQILKLKMLDIYNS